MKTTEQILPGLPALKGLGDLAALQPCIVIDTREPWPHPWARFWQGVAIQQATLETGDLALAGALRGAVIERKTVSDFLAAIGQERERNGNANEHAPTQTKRAGDGILCAGAAAWHVRPSDPDPTPPAKKTTLPSQ
ncbi:MAG: hypothetical protein AAB676_06000 [Verrucomicrobiota bacterium]